MRLLENKVISIIFINCVVKPTALAVGVSTCMFFHLRILTYECYDIHTKFVTMKGLNSYVIKMKR